ncbi:hypothetical protein GCM10027039_02540 [Terrabacter koreensis]
MAPEMVTVAPGAGRNTMGEPETPECQGNTSSVYVPLETSTVWPATATLAALAIVQYGTLEVPVPVSEHPVLAT